jgi:hypothetical protein
VITPIDARLPDYAIFAATDTFVLLVDYDNGPSITNQAEAVIAHASKHLGGIGCRRVYYRDTSGLYAEITTENDTFTGFKACSEQQQVFLGSIICRNLDGVIR